MNYKELRIYEKERIDLFVKAKREHHGIRPSCGERDVVEIWGLVT